MTAFLVMLQSGGVDQGLWPAEISGWVALILGIVAVGGGIAAIGRFVGTLNGFGVRLTDVERAHEKAEGQHTAMQREVDRILTQQAATLERLGESKRSAEVCREETVDMGISIGSKIDHIGREVNAMNLHLSQRLKAVETVLKLKGD